MPHSSLYLTATIVFFVATLALLSGAVYAGSRFLLGPGARAGSGNVRLAGLGVASLLFFPLVARLVPALLELAARLLLGAPPHFREGHAALASCARPRDCGMEAWAGVFESALGALSGAAVESGLASVPLHWVVLFLLTWAAAVHVARLAVSDPAGRDGRTNLALVRTRVVSPLRRNGPFVAAIAAGTYLSIASMVALPGLMAEEDARDEVSPQRLADRLNGARHSFPLPAQEEDPLSTVRQALGAFSAAARDESPAADPVSGPAAPPEPAPAVARLVASDPSAAGAETRVIPAWVPSLHQDLAELERERARLLERRSALAEELRSRQDNTIATAVSTYEVVNLDRKGSRQRGDHFIRIVTSFNAHTARSDSVLRALNAAVAGVDRELMSWGRTMRGWLGAPSLYVSDDDYAEALVPVNFAIARADEVAARSAPPAWPVPRRGEMGTDLGPFGYVAGWLLRTESLPLVLIAGMLGFGLLGSVASTIVREQKRRSPGDPPVPDLARVVIRGASAAVVVFLMVEGGLSVFSSGAATPNPYMLLLTCLVAAVFGEDVWKATQSWFNERLETAMATTLTQATHGGTAVAAIAAAPATEAIASTSSADPSSDASPPPSAGASPDAIPAPPIPDLPALPPGDAPKTE